MTCGKSEPRREGVGKLEKVFHVEHCALTALYVHKYAYKYKLMENAGKSGIDWVLGGE
jgi:hypothetical protein